MMRIKTFYACCHSEMGIGNRLGCIASACRLKSSDEHLIILWGLKGQRSRITVRFGDLFSLNGSVEINSCDKFSEPYYDKWRIATLPGEVPKGFANKLNSGQYALENEGSTIDLEYNRIPKNIIDVYKPIFNNIVPSNSILQKANAVERPTFAIHVRNNRNDWHEVREQPIKLFIDRINKLDDRVYLCCHTQEVQQQIEAAVPNGKVYSLPNKKFDDPTDIVADMLILGRSTYLYTSYLSTFPYIGWWFGGCKGIVEQIVDFTDSKNFIGK